MNLKDFYNADSDYLLRIPNYNQPEIISRGKGCFLFNLEGEKFLDFSSGWNVSNLGWSNKKLLKQLKKSKAPTYIPPWFTNEYKVNLAKEYSNYLKNGYKIMFGVSGSDAVEFALKTAIKNTKSNNFISFKNSFHGSTFELLKCGDFPHANKNFLLSSDNYKRLFLPDKNRIDDWDNYIKSVIKIIRSTKNLSGLILEPIFTNPGMLSGDSSFYKVIQDELKNRNALLIVDEIGTGFGRTGKMFAFEHFHLEPDIIVLGKAITSGIAPLSCILVKNEYANECKGIGFYSTYGGTPLACDIALKNFKILRTKNFLTNIEEIGEFAIDYINQTYKEVNSFFEVRGKGLSLGIELTDPLNNPLTNDVMEEIKAECLKNRLIVNFSNYTSTFIIMPPLIISKTDLLIGLDILRNSVVKILQNDKK